MGAMAAASAHATATMEGQWQCQDHGTTMPIRGAQVELISTGLFGSHDLFGSIVATGETDANGRYALSSSDAGDHFVRLVLHDSQGVELKETILLWDFHADTPTVNLGQGRNLVGASLLQAERSYYTPVCAVWQGAHDAYSDYQTAIGAAPPYGHDLLVRGNSWLTAGVPFTSYTTLTWPTGYPTGSMPGDFTTVRHEFGHSVRHAFDGDGVHFLGDVVVHAYLQFHSHCQTTNPGFAFNEGWAEFWSGETTPCNAGNPEGHQDVEGDVAASLARLQARCNNSLADMVRVLQQSPGVIHSFAEYQAHLGRCVPMPTPAPPAPPAPTVSTPASLAGAVRDRRALLAGLRRELSDWARELRAATRAARRLRPCAGSGCDHNLGILVQPPLLRGKIAIVRLEASLLAPYATPRGSGRFFKLSETKQIAMMNAPIRKFAGKVPSIIRRAVSDALGTIRPLVRRDHSSVARGAAARLRSLLRAGPSLDVLGVGPSPGTRVSRTPVRSFPPPSPWRGIFTPMVPAPTPTPVPVIKQSTSLTLSCPPATSKVGTAFPVSGDLTPALNARPIRVVYSLTGGGAQTQTVATDAAGHYSDNTATPTVIGTYTIQANFDGDATYAPSSSPVCTAMVF